MIRSRRFTLPATCGGVAKESLKLSHTHEEEFRPVCRIDFRNALDSANRKRNDGNELHLKVGLHRGPVIVVALNNRLDYFGRTVNIAARVESLAGSREICMSDKGFRAPGVTRALKARVGKVSQGKATLKGIGAAMTIDRAQALQSAPTTR